MQVTETKKIELTSLELEYIIRKGLGISNKSKLKLSFKVPNTVKVSIETITNVMEEHINKETEIKKSTIIDPNAKVCGNCSYPYSIGDTKLFCEMANQEVPLTYTCRSFEFKPKG